jgi:uncharacterized DUF497 family protein
MRIYGVRYEWDQAKNLQNQRKHRGISFEAAALVFDDPNCLVVPDRIDGDTGESRWHALGQVQLIAGLAAVWLVVHVYREDSDGEEIIRIVSAREADTYERRRYKEQSLD